MWKTVEPEQDHPRHRLNLTFVLPAAFRHVLQGTDEVLVSSREDGREGRVRTWFIITREGTLYLFNYAYARRVARWRDDPWVRLTVPGTGESVEGRVQFIDPAELDDAVEELIVDLLGM